MDGLLHHHLCRHVFSRSAMDVMLSATMTKASMSNSTWSCPSAKDSLVFTEPCVDKGTLSRSKRVNCSMSSRYALQCQRCRNGQVKFWSKPKRWKMSVAVAQEVRAFDLKSMTNPAAARLVLQDSPLLCAKQLTAASY